MSTQSNWLFFSIIYQKHAYNGNFEILRAIALFIQTFAARALFLFTFFRIHSLDRISSILFNRNNEQATNMKTVHIKGKKSTSLQMAGIKKRRTFTFYWTHTEFVVGMRASILMGDLSLSLVRYFFSVSPSVFSVVMYFCVSFGGNNHFHLDDGKNVDAFRWLFLYF